MRRVLVYSPVNALLRTNGFGASFDFDVPVGERVGSGPITPQNVVLARSDATAIGPVSARAGTVFVTPVYREPESGVVNLFLASVIDTPYLIQATTDFVRWENIATNLATGDFMDLVDADAANHPKRFYRSALSEVFGEFGSATVLPDGRLVFSVNGASGRSYTLQGSTNLVVWENLRACFKSHETGIKPSGGA